MLRRAKRPTTKYSPFSPLLEQQRCGDGWTDTRTAIIASRVVPENRASFTIVYLLTASLTSLTQTRHVFAVAVYE